MGICPRRRYSSFSRISSPPGLLVDCSAWHSARDSLEPTCCSTPIAPGRRPDDVGRPSDNGCSTGTVTRGGTGALGTQCKTSQSRRGYRKGSRPLSAAGRLPQPVARLDLSPSLRSRAQWLAPVPFRAPASGPAVGHRQPWALLDDPGFRDAKPRAGPPRPLSLAAPSQLPDRASGSYGRSRRLWSLGGSDPLRARERPASGLEDSDRGKGASSTPMMGRTLGICQVGIIPQMDGAAEWTRTTTSSRTQVPETCASTNSATAAAISSGAGRPRASPCSAVNPSPCLLSAQGWCG